VEKHGRASSFETKMEKINPKVLDYECDLDENDGLPENFYMVFDIKSPRKGKK
jgi:hypothetical protein